MQILTDSEVLVWREPGAKVLDEQASKTCICVFLEVLSCKNNLDFGFTVFCFCLFSLGFEVVDSQSLGFRLVPTGDQGNRVSGALGLV